MKIVVIEPLAVEEKRFLEIARAAVGQEHEIVCYDTRTTDVKELGERGKDADIIALGNLPFPREVLEQCENLKMLAVAFTGLWIWLTAKNAASKSRTAPDMRRPP